MERESIEEMTFTRRRLMQKLSSLERSFKTEERPVRNKKERVTCIYCTLSEAERTLLEKGPKFVPHKGKFTTRELREVESNVECTISNIRLNIKQTTSVGREGAKTEDDSRNGETRGDSDSDRDEERSTISSDIKLQRLKGPLNRMKQPDRVDPGTENKMHRLKENILRAYSCYRVRKPNTTTEEKRALKTLREKDLVIKRSDKSKSLVVMSREAYKEKCMEILTVKNNYEETNMTKETFNRWSRKS